MSMEFALPEGMYRDDFKDHVIEPDGPDSYLYHQPGTWAYRCYIQFRHGYIIIYGDCGPFVFCPADKDALAWAKGSIDSPDYVLGKLKTHSEAFDWEATKHGLIEAVEDDPERMSEIVDAMVDNEHDAYDLACELGLDTESVRYTWKANGQAGWAYWILRTFIEKLGASKP